MNPCDLAIRSSLAFAHCFPYAQLYGVLTYHPRIIFERDPHPIWPPPRLALSDHDRWHDLFPQLGLPLLDRYENHVTNASSRETIEAGTDAFDGDDVEGTGAGVVCAVDTGSPVRTGKLIAMQIKRKVASMASIEKITHTGKLQVILSLLPEAPPRLQHFMLVSPDNLDQRQ